MRDIEDEDVIKMIRHIPVPAGGAVFWDYRIPHSNSYRNDTDIPREVVYCSFLPDVDINRKYVRCQLEDLKRLKVSREVDSWSKLKKNCLDRKFDEIEKSEEHLGGQHIFTDFEKKLIGMKDW